MNKISLVLIFLLAVNCSTSENNLENKEDGPIIIKLMEAFEGNEIQNISQFGSKIEYVQLETNSRSLIAGNAKVYVDDLYIRTVAFRQILLFERKSGRFIKELSHYGNDPSGYLSALPSSHPNDRGQLYPDSTPCSRSLRSRPRFTQPFSLSSCDVSSDWPMSSSARSASPGHHHPSHRRCGRTTHRARLRRASHRYRHPQRSRHRPDRP